jgi:hypothetical protein
MNKRHSKVDKKRILNNIWKELQEYAASFPECTACKTRKPQKQTLCMDCWNGNKYSPEFGEYRSLHAKFQHIKFNW